MVMGERTWFSEKSFGFVMFSGKEGKGEGGGGKGGGREGEGGEGGDKKGIQSYSRNLTKSEI